MQCGCLLEHKTAVKKRGFLFTWADGECENAIGPQFSHLRNRNSNPLVK